jgi:hypothetical protein
MIIREKKSNSTLQSMFDLIWDNSFFNIDLETQVKVFPELDNSYTYSYVSWEGKVIIELAEVDITVNLSNSYVGNYDFINLLDKVNFAQFKDWKVYLITKHRYINENFLGYIASDINKRSLRFRSRKN